MLLTMLLGQISALRLLVCWLGARNMEEKLLQYVMASANEASNHFIHSIATDKASPAGMHLQNSFLTFPSGISTLCCPVVDHGYHGENVEEEIASKRRRVDLLSAAPADSAMQQRQVAWLHRAVAENKSSSWRPCKLHRMAARRWDYSLDRQLMTSTDKKGLATFKPWHGATG